MEAKPTALDKEIIDITLKSTSFVFPKIKMVIHTIDYDDLTIDILTNINVNSNYTTNITDNINVEFTIGMGEFMKKIYSNKDNMEASLVFKHKLKSITKRYKVVVVTKAPVDYNSKIRNVSAEALDTQDVQKVVLQLIDPLTLALKNTVTSGCYHNLTITKLLSSTFSYNLKDVTVLGKPLDYKLNIFPLDNEVEYKNILIPAFTNVVKLPYTLQKGDYGLYNHDVGIYFSNIESNQKTVTYNINVFPMFDYDRYEKEKDLPKLLIVNPSVGYNHKNDFNAYYDVDTYKVIVGDVEFKNDTEEVRFKNGTGIIETKSDIITQNISEITDEQIIVTPETLYGIENIDGKLLDYSKFINTKFDDNTFKYRSNVNKNTSLLAIMRVTNIDFNIIEPGMAVKYMFLKDKKAMFTTGTVQAIDYNYDISKKFIHGVIIVRLRKL